MNELEKVSTFERFRAFFVSDKSMFKAFFLLGSFLKLIYVKHFITIIIKFPYIIMKTSAINLSRALRNKPFHTLKFSSHPILTSPSLVTYSHRYHSSNNDFFA